MSTSRLIVLAGVTTVAYYVRHELAVYIGLASIAMILMGTGMAFRRLAVVSARTACAEVTFTYGRHRQLGMRFINDRAHSSECPASIP
jgi:hypothetical protein